MTPSLGARRYVGLLVAACLVPIGADAQVSVDAGCDARSAAQCAAVWREAAVAAKAEATHGRAAVGRGGKAPGAQATRDSLWNGTLIGAGVGFAGGFFGLAAYNAKETASGPLWDSEAIGYYTGAGILGAGIGAGLGALIDALRKDVQSPLPGARLRVSPLLSGRHRGAQVAIGF